MYEAGRWSLGVSADLLMVTGCSCRSDGRCAYASQILFVRPFIQRPSTAGPLCHWLASRVGRRGLCVLRWKGQSCEDKLQMNLELEQVCRERQGERDRSV